MRLQLPNKFEVKDLLLWVKSEGPKSIEMTPAQRDWYIGIIRQHTFDRPLKFMQIPIVVLE